MGTPNLVFIVPYRDRQEQKHHFDVYMKYILSGKTDYKIFYVHQCDNKPFNRGAMKNIGFLVMKELFPQDYKHITFIFNDVDALPFEPNIIDYDTRRGEVCHFYGFDYALGGIFSIKGSDFEKCGGFPNFWGWGLEDNIMNKRVIHNNISINRNNFYPIGSKEIMHFYDGLQKLVSKRDTNRYFENSGDTLHHIKNLTYQIDDSMINVTHFNTDIKPNEETFDYHHMIRDGTKRTADIKYMRKKWSLLI